MSAQERGSERRPTIRRRATPRPRARPTRRRRGSSEPTRRTIANTEPNVATVASTATTRAARLSAPRRPVAIQLAAPKAGTRYQRIVSRAVEMPGKVTTGRDERVDERVTAQATPVTPTDPMHERRTNERGATDRHQCVGDDPPSRRDHGTDVAVPTVGRVPRRGRRRDRLSTTRRSCRRTATSSCVGVAVVHVGQTRRSPWRAHERVRW